MNESQMTKIQQYQIELEQIQARITEITQDLKQIVEEVIQ